MKSIPALFVMMLALTACMGSGGSGPPDGAPINLYRNTEFDGENLRFFVNLADGTEVSVNTTDDAIESVPGTTPVPGHQARAWTFLKVTEGGTSVAHSLVSWDSDDPGDYLMAGWWAQFPDQNPPDLSFRDFNPFAIIDGPALDHGVAPQLPVGGAATYAGPAGGLYAYVFGSGWGENEGEFVIEEYQGTVILTADFTDGTLKGCIGCVGDLVTQRGHFGVFLGQEVKDVEGIARDYEIHLATAIIREDGMFDRNRLTLRHPERSITKSEGFWGGTLSSRQDTDGNPRLAAGFSIVSFKESDGSAGELVGSFVALSERFRENGVSRFPPGNGN